jgi:hypothetical protein
VGLLKEEGDEVLFGEEGLGLNENRGLSFYQVKMRNKGQKSKKFVSNLQNRSPPKFFSVDEL